MVYSCSLHFPKRLPDGSWLARSTARCCIQDNGQSKHYQGVLATAWSTGGRICRQHLFLSTWFLTREFDQRARQLPDRSKCQ